ncbi:MAG: hypothetical protein IJ438_08850 [Clostridia bacterium]|nr:hypothetical protein [Clostridia bacterium]
MSTAPEKKPSKIKVFLKSAALILPMFLIGALIGIIGAESLLNVIGTDDFGQYLLGVGWLLLCFYLSYVLQIILHEGGHLVFGLLSGYRFVSFNVMGFIWQKGADGKLRFGRMQIAGAGGQCLMAPPEYNGGNFPFTLYNLGGAAMNLIVSALCLVVALVFRQAVYLYILMMCMVLIGVFFAIMNGVPLPVPSIQNDGTNLLCIRRDMNARRAFWVQMNVAAEQAQGKLPSDMPEEWFAPLPEEAMDNPIVCTIAVMNTDRLMSSLSFTQAEAAIRKLLARKKGVLGLYRMSMSCDGATCELLDGRPGDLCESLSSKENQQMMKAMKTNPSILRTQYALALLKDRDADKAAKALAEFDKAAPQYPYQQTIAVERQILLAIQNAALRQEA